MRQAGKPGRPVGGCDTGLRAAFALIEALWLNGAHKFKQVLPFMRLEPNARAEGSVSCYSESRLISAVFPGADGAGWVKARSLTDGYEGYVRTDSLSRVWLHTGSDARSHIYPAPVQGASLNSVVFSVPCDTCKERKRLYPDRAWRVGFAAHLPMRQSARSPGPGGNSAAFRGVPYLWGGRTSAGWIALPLHSFARWPPDRMSTRSHGRKIRSAKTSKMPPFNAGIFVFFKGHVGIMLDGERVINATARHMTTCIENCEDVAEAYGGIVAVRRLTPQA
ncbi:MAG: hypothetical protein R3D66_02305 [Alphaproteobacteria bacterium]